MISWKFKSENCLPIGLAIDNGTIRMIQFCAKAGRLEVLDAAERVVDLSGQKDGGMARSLIISAISDMLEKGEFKGREVVSCLPSDELKITSIRLAANQQEQIENVLAQEAEKRFGFDTKKDIINYIFVGEIQQGEETRQELILLAAKDEVIREHISLLEEAGLVPVFLDAAPCALFRAFERFLKRNEDRKKISVFIDFGRQFTTVVFSRGDEIGFVKQIPVGSDNFTAAAAERLGVDFEQAQVLRAVLRKEKETQGGTGVSELLMQGGNVAIQSSLDRSTRQTLTDALTGAAEEVVKEISLCFRYYTVTFRGERIEKAFISGSEACEKALANVLSRHLSCEIELASPLRGINLKNATIGLDRRESLCEWSIPAGLALKGYSNL